jgi:heat shock protein HslJ
MKIYLFLLACLIGFATHAQTSKELIGKWKLIKQTQNGEVKTPRDTYQVFMEGGKFQGINGDNSRTGKWTLSDDNKELTIRISIVSIKFTVDFFDEKKRIISSDKTGTLEYEKVAE